MEHVNSMLLERRYKCYNKLSLMIQQSIIGNPKYTNQLHEESETDCKQAKWNLGILAI